ncbi:hypothetical protein PENTCL1PPCAC_2617 [Pristionchus entomophagus]|uniref:Major sperm protein n=1 Tax=Pristionchus entomophagus TaxID=358040 RepID=A0AAV5SAY3_9BILA|nr:hypothetical protein PENTCL1PPCAC_2617 [Pristionchus entomophagus]
MYHGTRTLSTSSSTLTLTNPTGQIQMYKLKITDNTILRVNPHMGFIDPSSTQIIKIYGISKTRPQENKHIMMVLHHSVTESDKKSTDLARIWKGDVASHGITRVQIHFQKPADNNNGEFLTYHIFISDQSTDLTYRIPGVNVASGAGKADSVTTAIEHGSIDGLQTGAVDATLTEGGHSAEYQAGFQAGIQQM